MSGVCSSFQYLRRLGAFFFYARILHCFISLMRNSVRSYILNLVAYEPGKPIEELAREIGFVPEKILKLASNENPLGPSPRALGAMRRALAQSHLYPDGGGFSLREAIA